MKHDYTKLDAAIIDKIRSGTANLTGLVCALSTLAEPFSGYRPAWRVIDRRLQALRKAGKITYSGGRWHVCSSDGSVQQ